MSEIVTDGWIDFFTAIASVAGAIFALFFVAIQVREPRWRGSPIRTFATLLSLAELAAPLLVALITLLPPHHWQWGAWFVGFVGLCLVVGFIGLFGREYRYKTTPLQGLDWFQLAGTTIVSGAVFTWMCVLGWAEDEGALRWLGWLCAWLVMSGITEAWVLMTAATPAKFEEVKLLHADGSETEEFKVAITRDTTYQGFTRPETYEMRAPRDRVLEPLDKVGFGPRHFSWKRHPTRSDRRSYRYYVLTTE